MDRLYQAAIDARIIVTEGDIPTSEHARYYHSHRCIVLRSGLTGPQLKSAFGHELGHAHFGHAGGCDPDRGAKQERLADEYAARLLITADEYRDAEQLHGPNEHAIALALDVTPALVRVWRRIHERRVPHRGIRRRLSA